MLRRHFLQSVGAVGMIDVLPNIRQMPADRNVQSVLDRREHWVAVMTKIADPLLGALSQDRLKERMPVETHAGNPVDSRKRFTYLEGFGRLFCGIAPWIELGPDSSSEGKLRGRYTDLLHDSLVHAVNPAAQDFMNFTEGAQPLVDASFLALGLMRAPSIWHKADDATKRNVIEALKHTRAIKPGLNNWLLFSALIEAFLLWIGEEYDKTPIDYALRQHEQWYKGDGMFGDGPDFHWDYYNSFVIQPYMRIILDLVATADRSYAPLKEKFNSIAGRYAVVLERLIGEDGSYPAVGRSIAYRCGAFHHLAQEALLRKLPKEISTAQVRGALSAVINKTLASPMNFDENGWLRLGLSGYQPGLAEYYISTGSLYLCSVAFLPLGLSQEDEFWKAPPAPWTAKKIWNGQDMTADAALKL